jgi:hypothetical protein
MAHFDQFSTIDRDMKNTEVAKGFFERVVNNYPQSPFAAKSQEKLAKCLEYLAGHEFEIASYYMREKKYPAARDRLEGILRRYRNTSVAPKALYQLGESYRQEKNNVKAALAFDALTQHYPNDPLAKDARSQLTQIAQEKQDPLTALLKQEPRPAAALAQNKTADDTKADAKASAKDAPRIAKTEVVDEKPGDDKSFLERVANKLNPFSSSSPAPAKEPEKKPTATARTSKTVSPNNAQLISSIDSSLERRTSASASEPAPPAPDLPQITEAPLPPSRNEAATLSAIDGKLEKKTQVAAVVPPPPQAAPVLKTPIVDEKALAQSKSQGQPATDPATLLSSIDTKLNRQGINGQSEETKLELPAGQKPIATPRPKPAVPEKVLDTKIKTETGPLFLPQQEIRGQEKEAETPAPAATASAPAPSPSLPELAVKGPPQPDKPADTKVAGKPKTTGDDALDDPENKGVFDQLKEDLQRVGKILNPFSW